MRKLSGDRNQCPTCGDLFNSTAALVTALDRLTQPRRQEWKTTKHFHSHKQ